VRTREAGAKGPSEVAELEARLREVLDEVTALDLELEVLSQALADFSRDWERRLGKSFAARSVAERLVRRLEGLEDALAAEVARLEEPMPAKGRRQARGRRAAGPGHRARAVWGAGLDSEGDVEADAVAEASGQGSLADPSPEVEAAEVALKRLYRRLARLLHPDLAQDEAEARRLSDLMARVNAAYARADLTELSVMAERVGAGEPLGELTLEERRAHLGARIATLERIAASLKRERARLSASDTERLRAEAARRAQAGGDLVEETRAELAEEADLAYVDALHRLARLERAARTLARARKVRMGSIEKRGPTGARRAFDPLAESELVRRGAARLEEKRATAAARELARGLEDLAGSAPWEVALTFLAFFAEVAGGRPPESLATAEALAATWDLLREDLVEAPDLARALAKLPRHLTLGARAQGDLVLAGLQLLTADLAAGVQLAMARPAVAPIAAAVLAGLGPKERCPGCRAAGPALHLHRTRGLDTLHGMVCGRCGRVLRSYWRYGELDGLEALAPHALKLGLVAEVTATLGGTSVGFQLLPDESLSFTAERLRRRFAELYLDPYEVELAAAAIQVVAEGGPLSPGARLAGQGRLELVPAPGQGTTGPELLELLRARIERRFRP
jgi:hypothetical protein